MKNRGSTLKQHSYPLFPAVFRVLGAVFLTISIYILVFAADYSNLREEYQALIGALAFALFGGILITFRGSISVDPTQRIIMKKNSVLGILLTKELIKIPEDVHHILIQHKVKKGKGFVQGVIGFSYDLNSSDLFLTTNSGAVRILNTDRRRADKIAELLKEVLNIEVLVSKNDDIQKKN